MSLLHDAYTALLAGLTHKTGKEIHWYDKYNNPITIEPIDIENERYIIRYYYPNGQKQSEMGHKNGQRHGKYLWWYDNGKKLWEEEYKNGRRYGKSLGWYENGQKCREEEYDNGELIRKIL